MSQKKSNTLFIGNGFSRAIFKETPSWSDLINAQGGIDNYTILYEMRLLDEVQNVKDEDKVKDRLVEKIKASFSLEKLNKDVCCLNEFGNFLRENNVRDIITTNYDNGIEILLRELCDYTQETGDETGSETVYSVRTHKEFVNAATRHSVRLWKIHGDLDRIKSVTLGFDQYCGALAKIESYIKGTYESHEGEITCKVPMKEKCMTGKFDELSWVELFFNSNVYIVGFGMAFSEIDIWWLINKRARFKTEIPQIENTITYLYDTRHLNKDRYIENQKIRSALTAFDVDCREIDSSSGYIESIFEQIS